MTNDAFKGGGFLPELREKTKGSMRTDLIITADLGLLRAYRIVQGINDRQPHLELVDELRPESAHEKLSEQLTDQAGRFPKGGGSGNVTGDLSAGERHNLELEQKRRLIKLLAERINALLAEETVTGCFMAASAPIHTELLGALTATVRAKIEKIVPFDLTKAEPRELLERFQRER